MENISSGNIPSEEKYKRAPHDPQLSEEEQARQPEPALGNQTHLGDQEPLNVAGNKPKNPPDEIAPEHRDELKYSNSTSHHKNRGTSAGERDSGGMQGNF